MEFRNHYFQKHNILKKGKIEKQPCPKTDEMYKKALAASNLKSGGTIFNMIEGLERPTHDRIGRPLSSANANRKRSLQGSANKNASDSEDEDTPLALLASQSGGQLPWEEPKPKKKRARKQKNSEVQQVTAGESTMALDKNDHSGTALVPIEDPPSIETQPPTQPPTQVSAKTTRQSTRRSGRAKTVKSYIENLDEDEENDEELLDILNAAQQKLNSKRTKQSTTNKNQSNDQPEVSQPVYNEEHSGQGTNTFNFGAIQNHCQVVVHIGDTGQYVASRFVSLM